MTTEPIPYLEMNWLEYGTDYSVTDIEDQDTGGTLTLLHVLPPEAEQLVIRRVTSRTQEIDLHNGARLPAELLEGMGDKVTMEIQEIAEQSISKDFKNEILQELNEDVKGAIAPFQAALEDEARERNEADQGLQEALETEARERDEADNEIKNYADEQIAHTVAATQTWLPSVDSILPTITDMTKTYLCKVRGEQIVYQCVAGQTSWAPYDDRTDLVNEDELEAALDDHDESGEAHADIRNAISDEEQARENADRDLQEQINNLVPEGLENLPNLIGQKADKVIGATNGNLAALDAQGNLVDSGASLLNTVANGTVSTVAATAAKTATIPNFIYAQSDGKILALKFAAGNTAINLTLNISSQGARPIFYRGAMVADNNPWTFPANTTVLLQYNLANSRFDVVADRGSAPTHSPTFTGDVRVPASYTQLPPPEFVVVGHEYAYVNFDDGVKYCYRMVLAANYDNYNTRIATWGDLRRNLIGALPGNQYGVWVKIG